MKVSRGVAAQVPLVISFERLLLIGGLDPPAALLILGGERGVGGLGRLWEGRESRCPPPKG